MPENFLLLLLSFVGLNFILLLNASLISLCISNFKIKSGGKFILSIFLIFSLLILSSQIALGIFGLLNYGAIWIFHLVFFGIIVFIFKKKKPKKIVFPPSPQLNSYILLIIGPFIALFLVRYFYTLLQVPLEYDSIAYHLPFAVEWFKTESLLAIYYNAFAGPVGYYPGNFELLELWTFLPFGNDFFVNLINFFLLPILILGSYSVLKNLKLSTSSIWAAISFLIYMPIVHHFFGFPHVEVFFMVTFVLSIYFLQEFWTTKFTSDLWLSGIALGLFVGTKYLGIPYAFPLLLVAGIAILKNSRNDKWNFIGAVSRFIGGGILGGGFWYIRNWIQSGNPIFPTEVNIAGHELFQGYYGLTERIFTFSLAYNVQDLVSLKEFLHGFFERVGIQSIFIPMFGFILLAYLFFLGYKLLVTHKKSGLKNKLLMDFFLGMLLLFGSIFYFYFYWQSPYSYSTLVANVRYSMMFLFVTSVMVGVLVDKIKILESFFYSIFPLAVFYNIAFLIINKPSITMIEKDRIPLDYSFIFQHGELFVLFLSWCALLVGGIYFLIKTFSSEKLHKLYHWGATLFLIFFTITTLSLFNKSFPERESLRNYFYEKYYTVEPLGALSLAQVANWFDEQNPNAKIAYTGSPFHYYLFGRNLQREVDYININDCPDCRYFEYRNSPESIRRDPDFGVWMNNLRIKNKEYLIIAPNVTPGVKSWEFEWVQNNPQYFKNILQKDSIYVYRIFY